MIRGLLRKTLDEVWLSTLLFGGALLLVKALLTYIVPQVQEGVNEMVAQLPFVRTLMSALLGIELSEEITARMLQAIVWVHPAVLAVLWAQEIVYCTRMPAGEIEAALARPEKEPSGAVETGIYDIEQAEDEQ